MSRRRVVVPLAFKYSSVVMMAQAGTVVLRHPRLGITALARSGLLWASLYLEAVHISTAYQYCYKVTWRFTGFIKASCDLFPSRSPSTTSARRFKHISLQFSGRSPRTIMNIVRRITKRPRDNGKVKASLGPLTYYAPQPGEDFTLVLPEEISPLDSMDLAGGSEGFTNYRVEWQGRNAIIQQFQGPNARRCFEEHLEIIHRLRDSSIPVRWVAGVSYGAVDAPFILYSAYSIWNDLKPLVKTSLESYIQIPMEKRAADYEAWLQADNIDNFFRHLDPASFKKILH